MKQLEFYVQGLSRGSSSVTRQNDELQSQVLSYCKTNPKHSQNSRTQRNTPLWLLLKEDVLKEFGVFIYTKHKLRKG